MEDLCQRLAAHCERTRRHFFQLGGAGAAAWAASPLAAANAGADPRLREAIAALEYLTPLERIFVLDKGKAGVASLTPEKQREIGQAPETWTLEVVADPASDSVVDQPLSIAAGNALDWNGLMKLAEKHAVRFPHVCTCTNGADPYHMTLWEGVPFREVIRLAGPHANIRRVYYQSYHPGDLPPFQGSLALSQILETPPGQTPPVLAYKMNGRIIPASNGGPVRVIVPGAYGGKHIKWVRRIVMTNNHKANDSDADLNNDTESPLKTRARFIHAPKEISANTPAALTGMAQVGVSGLQKVQYCVHSQKEPSAAGDPNLAWADWKDAAVLPRPAALGGGPPEWPVRFVIVHWAALLPGLPAGSYELCCRTIDGNGTAQPLPRPLLRTGFNAIHRVPLVVKA